MSKTAIVTGASRGLGLSLSKLLLEMGYAVYGISRTQESWAKAREFCSNDHFKLFSCDLTSEKEVQELLNKIFEESSSIDLLVNNAGYGGGLERVEGHAEKELEHHLRQNLFSSFFMAKHILPAMKKRGSGQMIHISSMAGKRAVPHLFGYSASKFGQLALSQCLAKENTDWDFKSVTVCPGGMNTKMRADIFGAEDASQQQSTDYVASVILQIISGEIEVASGGDIVIRHGKITAINKAPAA